MRKFSSIALWIICIAFMCYFTRELVCICADQCEKQEQRAREDYERQRMIVLVKFIIPPEHRLFIDGRPCAGAAYLSSLNTYKVELRKDDVVVKSFDFKPKSPYEINSREVIDLKP